MSDFTPDYITSPSITSPKGVEIKLGDIIVTKGSTTHRVVQGIQGVGDIGNRQGLVRGVRLDGSSVAHSRWLNPDKLKVIGTVL